MAYLLFLQDIRLALGPGAESVVTAFSDGMLYLCFLLPFLIYWGIDKEFGTFTIGCYEGARVMNGLIKVTACINRPWILDARIQPSDSAKVHATGYSFPSGHTTSGAATFGTIACYTRRTWLRIICWILIPLIMLARNYLGVHMAKDVLVGFGSTIVLVLLAGPIRKWIREHNVQWWQIVVTVIAICAVIGAYTLLKPYPVSEVVDPKAMQKDTLKSLCECIGCVIGLWLESCFVHFETTGKDIRTRVIRIVIGIVLLYIMYKRIAPIIGAPGYLIVGIVATFVIPFLFTWAERKIGHQ